MTTETVYFDNGNVKVTNSRLIVKNQTFAMSGITSVNFVEVKPNRLLPIGLLIGGLLVPGAQHATEIGHYIVFAVPGALWLALQRSRYAIRIGSASGESQALDSKYKDFVNGVVAAINKAIIERG
jgi:hypothetical protein